MSQLNWSKWHSHSQNVLWIAVLSLLLLPLPVVAATHAGPPQPTALSVTHRSGQSFITWQERSELQGLSYRVYRHTAPITSSNIVSATLLYEVPEGSSQFYANRYRDYSSPPNWQPRYVDRFIVTDLGQQLPGDSGLLVWTLGPSDFGGGNKGSAYYAVTTVDGGIENIDDFTKQNTYGPVSEAIGDPTPILIQESDTGWHAFIQYMDLRSWNPTFHAPNSTNSYYGLDSTDPKVKNAIQYAYDYAVFVPGHEQCGETIPDTLPVLVSLHAWQGNVYPPPSSASSYCAYVIRPVDVTETWWYGFARNHDFRLGGSPVAGDEVVNYTEYRVLRMVYDLIRDPLTKPVDPERVYVSGHSMGASGALAFALRYPNVFAASYASKPMTNYREAGGWTGSVASKWGQPIAGTTNGQHGTRRLGRSSQCIRWTGRVGLAESSAQSPHSARR